jgi:TRAP-type mannitol/chloroaromatic compound transport system permease large subunit
MLITLPLFMPIVTALGFDPIWFAVIMLVNLEMGNMSPPFGMLIFVMQGVAPKDVTYEKIVWATVPYMLFDVLIMVMIFVWPQIALWLPTYVGSYLNSCLWHIRSYKRGVLAFYVNPSGGENFDETIGGGRIT